MNISSQAVVRDLKKSNACLLIQYDCDYANTLTEVICRYTRKCLFSVGFLRDLSLYTIKSNDFERHLLKNSDELKISLGIDPL